MIELLTEHLKLRKAQQSDLEAIWRNVWRDNELAKTMMWKVTEDFSEAQGRLERTINYQNSNHAFFVCLKITDEPIGFAGVYEETPSVFSESGICIARAYQEKGYGKEVLAALKDLVFAKLHGKRFVYTFCQGNEKSKRLCISQGFTYLETKKITRDYDGREFTVDCYFCDKK